MYVPIYWHSCVSTCPIPGHRTNKGIKMAIHKGERGAFPL